MEVSWCKLEEEHREKFWVSSCLRCFWAFHHVYTTPAPPDTYSTYLHRVQSAEQIYILYINSKSYQSVDRHISSLWLCFSKSFPASPYSQILHIPISDEQLLSCVPWSQFYVVFHTKCYTTLSRSLISSIVNTQPGTFNHLSLHFSITRKIMPCHHAPEVYENVNSPHTHFQHVRLQSK